MCTGSAPKPPAPLPERQVAQAPTAAVSNQKSLANLMRRASMSSSILTGPGGTGAAQTRGVSLLGQ